MLDKEQAQIVEIAKQLQEYCAAHPGCHGCIFRDVSCVFSSSPGLHPMSWELPAVPRWSDADKAYAAAIKQFGVYAVRRYHGAIRYSGLSERTKTDSCSVIGVLADLKEGEEIAIDDIINEEG